MKKLFFILFIIGFTAVNTTVKGEYKSTASVIDLTGSTGTIFGKGPTRAKSVTPPLQVSQDENAIYVDFFRSVGDVTVTVYDQTGQRVYQNVVATAYGVTDVIDTTYLPEGMYRIVFTNTSGMNLEGIFVL